MNRDFCPPIRDQLSCGSCISFGTIGIWETKYNKIYHQIIDLSEKHLFSCSGGNCLNGSYIEDALQQTTRGVALEQDLHYDGYNCKCEQYLPNDWWKRGKKVANWETISGIENIKTRVIEEPLIGLMTVHESFKAYISGVYHNLGPTDPSAGDHCVGLIDYDINNDAFLLRNSWGLDWGMSGYAWIRSDQIKTKAYALVPTDVPLPTQPSPPNLWTWLITIIRRIFG